jgi:hypothetical protein
LPAWSPDGSLLVASAPYADAAFTGIGVFTLSGTWTTITRDPAPGAEQTVDQFDADWQPLSGERHEKRPPREMPREMGIAPVSRLTKGVNQ